MSAVRGERDQLWPDGWINVNSDDASHPGKVDVSSQKCRSVSPSHS